MNTDRNYFAACMVALGDADAMVYRRDPQLFGRARGRAPGDRPEARARVIGVSMVLARGRTVLVADTAVPEMPNADELADIAVEAAASRAGSASSRASAMLAYSTFGHPPGERSERIREAVQILDQRRVDFEV